MKLLKITDDLNVEHMLNIDHIVEMKGGKKQTIIITTKSAIITNVSLNLITATLDDLLKEPDNG